MQFPVLWGQGVCSVMFLEASILWKYVRFVAHLLLLIRNMARCVPHPQDRSQSSNTALTTLRCCSPNAIRGTSSETVSRAPRVAGESGEPTLLLWLRSDTGAESLPRTPGGRSSRRCGDHQTLLHGPLRRGLHRRTSRREGRHHRQGRKRKD